MREIKFRAWCTGTEEMFDDVSTWTDDFTDMLNSTISWLQSDSPDDGACILMQYTGLKDRNGKEIYEGDVLLTDDMYHDYQGGIAINSIPDGECVEVRWQEGAFWVRDELLFEFVPHWEVIGNIYENPELLVTK